MGREGEFNREEEEGGAGGGDGGSLEKEMLLGKESAPVVQPHATIPAAKNILPGYYHENQYGSGAVDYGSETRICRCCHDDEGDDFIAPCSCSGSIRWVHRSCLDQWRAVSPNPNSFDNCDVCNTPYKYLRIADEEVNYFCLRVSLLVCKDMLLLGVIWQIMVWLCVGFMAAVTDLPTRASWMPEGWSPMAVNYVVGLLFFFFLVGIYSVTYATLKFCCGCCGVPDYTYDTYPYRSPDFCFFYCPTYVNTPIGYSHHHHHHHTSGCCTGSGSCNGGGCNCGGSDCGGGGGGKDCGEAMLVVAIIFIVIGIVVALGIGFYVFTNSAIYHTRAMKKKVEAAHYIVADLSTHNLHHEV